MNPFFSLLIKPILSLGFGILVAFIPAFVFAKIFFRKTGAQSAKTIVRSFYVGETLKLILTAFLFFCVFYVGKLYIEKSVILGLFVGFIMGQVVSVIVLYRKTKLSTPLYFRGRL